MSWETQSWAARQRPGSSSAKLVLLGLASCADANHCSFPSIQWLCDFSDLNRKTVIAALDRLAEGPDALIMDTGERRGRTRQVKVYRIGVGGLDMDDPDACETVPKAEQFQKRNSSVSSRKESQFRDTEPVLNLPPSSSNDEEAPAVDLTDGELEQAEPLPKPRGAHRLPETWAPPAITGLQPLAQALVQQWPAGAYAAACETFRCHWRAETGARARKLDWDAALSKWLITDHARVLRDARAGVQFEALAPKAPAPGIKPVAAQALEDDRSAVIHARLREQLGAASYAHWMAEAAILPRDGGIDVIVSSAVRKRAIEDGLIFKTIEMVTRPDMQDGGQVRIIVEYNNREQ